MTPGLLLDTNVVIDGVPVAGRTALSVVTVTELHEGIALAPGARERTARRHALAALLGRYEPLPVDDAVATAYGSVVGAVVAAGRRPRPRRNDLLLAATALAHDLGVCTTNVDDYRGLEDLVLITEP